MNKMFLLIVALALGCGGSLTDEQRKKMKENMELNRIRKVSEAQIVDEAYRQGRQISAILQEQDPSLTNRALLDSLEIAFKAEIIRLDSTQQNLHPVERKILEAYRAAEQTRPLSDNVQRMGEDSLVYTQPLPGTVFERAIGIRMLRKNVILSVKQ